MNDFNRLISQHKKSDNLLIGSLFMSRIVKLFNFSYSLLDSIEPPVSFRLQSIQVENKKSSCKTLLETLTALDILRLGVKNTIPACVLYVYNTAICIQGIFFCLYQNPKGALSFILIFI